MKSITKKVFIYIFCGLLTFSSTFMCYYKSAYAFEWAGGALAFEEALKWTLAVLGITATAGMTDSYWEEYGDEFVDYATENGATQAEVAEWQLKLCEGILDKASGVWDKFKSWASTLVSSGSGSGSGGNIVLTTPDSANNVSTAFCNALGFSPVTYSSINNYDVYCALSMANYNHYTGVSDGAYWLYLLVGDSSHIPSLVCNNSSGYKLKQVGGLGYIRLQIYNNGSPLDVPYISDTPTFIFPFVPVNQENIIFWNATLDNGIPFNYGILENGDGTTVEDIFQTVPGTDIENLDIISSDLPDVNDPEVSIPMPGIGTGDNSISSDAYDNIIDAINNGDLPIEEGIEDIQALLRVIAYDTETDDVFPTRPDPDDPNENVKKDDVINENKNNMGFTLAGLEGVFPFCIPWDIYAFMTLLVADPVAPEFDFPIKSVNNQTEEIHVDLTPFEPVAVVVRYIFDFLFIIGLAMLTRSLIGGGSSD